MTAAADEYVAKQPAGSALADALYLRGRALEEKAQRDAASPQKDVADAYNAYTEALAANPRPELEGLIHIGMGNVLYFQDRYAAAINELTSGYEKATRESDKAWALYRVGLCNQRLAKWDEADKFFAAVQQQYPGTAQAQRARDHQGAKAFWVQVATFGSPAAASTAADELKKQGLAAQLFVDTTRNAQVVRVGPLPTYDAATAMRQRVLGKYRDSIIVP
jgi:TolA-binding protein